MRKIAKTLLKPKNPDARKIYLLIIRISPCKHQFSKEIISSCLPATTKNVAGFQNEIRVKVLDFSGIAADKQ